MRKVDSFLKECLRIEGLKLSDYSPISYPTVFLISRFVSNTVAKGSNRLYLLRWNFYTERNDGCCTHPMSASR